MATMRALCRSAPRAGGGGTPFTSSKKFGCLPGRQRALSGLAAAPALAPPPGTDASVAARMATFGGGQLWIQGRYVPAAGGITLPVLSPRDGQPFARIAHAGPEDVDAAVGAARRAYEDESWSSSEREVVARRVGTLRALAEVIREPTTMAALVRLESADSGKPLGEAEGDISACADYCDYYADVAPRLLATEPLPTVGTDEPFVAQLRKEAVGVVGCISPWNYPLMQAVLKVAPAIAAGCAVVLKPAPSASLTCLALGQLAAEAGAPPGVLNVLSGGPAEQLPASAGGSSTGQLIIDHAGLDKLSFTGSGAAGQVLY
jgi:betaine-aldehyde dehydrogenase